jgi:tripartite ATP-independent transporter DctM subunit
VVLGLALAFVVWRKAKGDTPLPRAPSRVVGAAALAAIPGIALPFLIRAAVVEGVATATEVSTIGIVYAFVVGAIGWAFFKTPVQWRRMGPMLVETAALSGAILIIIGAATAMAWALTQSGFSKDLAGAMAHMPGGRAGFLAISVIAFVILGSILEGIPAIVLFGPLLFPIARAVGVHEVHYAMVVILAMGIGLFAPPFGVGYYAACAIGRVDPAEGIKPIWPYLVALLIGLALVTAVPWISTGFL